MRTVNIAVGAVIIVLIAVVSFLAYRPESPPTYNTATETKLTGTVQDVQEVYCPVTKDQGTHLILKTDNGPVTVHVAVARSLRSRNVKFGYGERVDVIGSKIRYKRADSIIAREIARGNEVFTLRDNTGKLLWTE